VNNSNDGIFGIPLNRIVAFVGPYISVASGLVAAWLLQHVHLLGLFHLQHDGLAAAIAQGLIFGLVTIITWLGHSGWLKGHHIQLAKGTVRSGEDVSNDARLRNELADPELDDPKYEQGLRSAGDLRDVPTDAAPPLGGNQG